jgi:hypothetical protein
MDVVMDMDISLIATQVWPSVKSEGGQLQLSSDKSERARSDENSGNRIVKGGDQTFCLINEGIVSDK